MVDQEEYKDIDVNYKISDEEMLRIIECVREWEEKGLI